MGLGFACFLRGAPRVPAAAQTVLAQTETIFGPSCQTERQRPP